MKIIFGLIIVGFCLWGVGDIIRNYQISRAVIKVGSQSITAGHFLSEFNKLKQDINQKELFEKKHVDIDIKETVINKLIDECAFECIVDRLKLVVSKETLLAFAKSMPEFQLNGKFDPRLYLEKLRESGLHEKYFLSYVRQSVLKNQLTLPLVLSYKAADFIKNRLLEKYSAKKRIAIYSLSTNNIKYTNTPTKEDIQEFYASNPDKYNIPETRSVVICRIPCVARKNITEEEVKKYYNEHKKELMQTQKTEYREIDIYCFDTINDANQGWKLINLKQITKMKKLLRPKVGNLKNTKSSMIEKLGHNVAEAIFNIKAVGRSTEVISDGKNYYVFVLKKINTVVKKPNEEQAMQIARNLLDGQNLKTTNFNNNNEISNKIDDAVAAGALACHILKVFH